MNIKELYQEIILDHGKNPRNQKKIDNYSNDAKGYNPLCGDNVHIYLKLNENKNLLTNSYSYQTNENQKAIPILKVKDNRINLTNDIICKLKSCDKKTQKLTLDGCAKLCKVVDIYDGDTCRVVFNHNGQINK